MIKYQGSVNTGHHTYTFVNQARKSTTHLLRESVEVMADLLAMHLPADDSAEARLVRQGETLARWVGRDGFWVLAEEVEFLGAGWWSSMARDVQGSKA